MAVTQPIEQTDPPGPVDIAERPVVAGEFAAHLNSLFSVGEPPDATVTAELVEVEERPSAPGHEQFSLLFRAPADAAPAQGIHPVEHPVLGRFHLFLVPIGRDAGGIRLEAAFNRFAAPTDAEG